MTQEELLKAINDSGLDAAGLTVVLRFAGALVAREKTRAAMAGERQSQAAAIQASEAKLQSLQAEFDAIDAQLASQA